ncbi:hypothetical protein HPB48_012755 [Haemaphysalis longicornis]|uniref:Uncharacterized protein n=1 Tax=Haemaphysalis longicornis TaxID=44386 RepID=A0A9J6GEI7_HAELO|nr:hypothetical protein HPB48_012755 [Haemaphysalis longicornis]
MGQRGGEERDSPIVSGAVLVFDKGHSLMERTHLCTRKVGAECFEANFDGMFY